VPIPSGSSTSPSPLLCLNNIEDFKQEELNLPAFNIKKIIAKIKCMCYNKITKQFKRE